MTGRQLLDAFVIAAPGIEEITAVELRTLAIEPAAVEHGGVLFRGSHRDIYNANLKLRTATRIVVRIARFHASSFAELERRAKKIEWERWLPSVGEVKFRVTCKKSRLYHSDAVAERLMNAAAKHCADLDFVIADKEDTADSEAAPSAQLFIVRLVRDEVTISADTSGELLHRRGYRLEATRASLRENLAAAMLLASRWKRDTPLLDPLCGSGTIPIEAAMIARGIAPGLERSFAFEKWPSFDETFWKSLKDKARSEQTPEAGAPVYGGDRDAGAVEVARRNAERAGVAADIEFSKRALAQSLDVFARTHAGSGAIVTNPPYGMRVSPDADLRNLYGMLGARAQKNNWSLGVLTSDDKLARQSANLVPNFRTQNGGIPVTFFTSDQAAEN
ncbi:MAG: class I SAM-dependent RNA methyltransferase [Gemmatimonadaceae bacterium]|nr:class I SAM-dependent RNA methyltransferase [Gemmatimonadaceae bacterium]